MTRHTDTDPLVPFGGEQHAFTDDPLVADPAGDGPPVRLCAACSRLGRCRQGLRDETLDRGVVTTRLECGQEYEGGPGVAHGGWIAGVMDEIVGHLPLLCGQLTVTGTLTVRFVKPVPIQRPLLATARLAHRQGSRWFIEARIDLASTGTVLAEASGVMVQRDGDHFERHRRWLADQDGLAAAGDPSSLPPGAATSQ